MTAVAIRADGLVRDFGRVRALDHLTLEVPAGIVFGFLGPNGAGKTTAIRTFLGLLEPTAGEARVLGFDVKRQSHLIRERSGALLEHSGLYERLTAFQNLDLVGRIWHIPKAARRARIRELLEQFGLWERRDQSVGQWSRGMKQKLAVARAVFHRPALVFLDEPTAGLDPVASAALREDLAKLALSEGVTIFLNTHNLSEAERLCSLVGVIRQGRLVALGPPRSLRDDGRVTLRIVASPLSEKLVGELLGLPGVLAAQRVADGVELVLERGASAAPIARHLVSRGVELEEMRRESPSLEETFMELITDEGSTA